MKVSGNNGEGRSKEPHSSHQRLETATSTAFLKTSTFWSLDTDWLSDAVAAKTEKLTKPPASRGAMKYCASVSCSLSEHDVTARTTTSLSTSSLYLADANLNS